MQLAVMRNSMKVSLALLGTVLVSSHGSVVCTPISGIKPSILYISYASKAASRQQLLQCFILCLHAGGRPAVQGQPEDTTSGEHDATATTATLKHIAQHGGQPDVTHKAC
jgi:hypothetical protein